MNPASTWIAAVVPGGRMLVTAVQPRLPKAGSMQSGQGLPRVGEVRVDPPPHERREGEAEDPLDGITVRAAKPQVSYVATREERDSRPSEPPPHPENRLFVEVGEQALSHDRQALIAIEACGQRRDAARPIMAQDIELDDLMVVAQRIHSSQGTAFSVSHPGEIALDVRQHLSVALRRSANPGATFRKRARSPAARSAPRSPV